MPSPYDVVIVGSGINSLVCAAELGFKGRRVLVLERNRVAGGCMRTEEVTLPDFRHDLFAMSLPLFVSAPHYARLGPALAAEGLRLVKADQPTAVAMPDGRTFVFTQSRDANVAGLEALAEGDGTAYRSAMEEIEANAELIFGLLGNEPRSWATLRLLGASLWRLNPTGLGALAGRALEPMRKWLERDFRSDVARALISPWILHTGLDPDAPLSAMMGKLILLTLETAGIPFVQGGISRLVEALTALIEKQGGEIRTGCDVEQILFDQRTAVGVKTTEGSTFAASRAVICNVTPTQLYGRLIKGSTSASDVAHNYSYGRSDMQIHLALSEPPAWADPALAGVGLVHLTSGLDGVSRAVNEAVRGMLPMGATIVVGQPAAADPSRCPPGRSLLWVQLQELPSRPLGDAAGSIPVNPSCGWSEELKAAYAARIIERMSLHITNLRAALLDVHVLSPADLENANINLVGGDPYSGACSLDQFYLFRPPGGGRNHETGLRRLYHIGASTHPGPGLGGMSGYLVAQRL